MADLRSASSVEEALKMLDDKIAALDRKKRAAVRVLRVTTSANSATWSSATKVVTNLTGTFTAVKGLTYRINSQVHLVNTVQAETEGLMLVAHAGGAVVISDTGDTPTAVRSLASGAIVKVFCSQEFTATADGTYGVGLLGYKPTGDVNAARLLGAAYAVNELWVEIVA